MRPETRAIYAEKFGLRIMEGYGATEAGPVIAVNTPMHYQAGTVGRLLPAIEARLDDVPGIGPIKRRLLLSRFGSVRGVRGASPAELETAVGKATASRLRAHFDGRGRRCA